MSKSIKEQADEIRLEFLAQDDLDLVRWKADFYQPGFVTVSEHIKEASKRFLDYSPF